MEGPHVASWRSDALPFGPGGGSWWSTAVAAGFVKGPQPWLFLGGEASVALRARLVSPLGPVVPAPAPGASHEYALRRHSHLQNRIHLFRPSVFACLLACLLAFFFRHGAPPRAAPDTPTHPPYLGPRPSHRAARTRACARACVCTTPLAPRPLSAWEGGQRQAERGAPDTWPVGRCTPVRVRSTRARCRGRRRTAANERVQSGAGAWLLLRI